MLSTPACDFVNESLSLSDHERDYPESETHHDRDHNANVNSNQYGQDTLQFDLEHYTIVP